MKWIKLITINAIVFLVLFAVLEVAVRISSDDYTNAYFTKNITRGQPIYLNERWGHRVGYDQINQELTRSDPLQERILFIGDSVTFGYGVKYEETYHQVAAELIAKAGCSTFVHGVGRLHSNLDTLMNSELRSFILDEYGADIIVYQFNVNDVPVYQAPRKTRTEELTMRDGFEKFRNSYLNRSAFLKWFQSNAFRYYERGQGRKLSDQPEYNQRKDSDAYVESWNKFENALGSTQRLLSQRGIRFVMLLVPESFRVSASELDNDLGVDLSGIETWPEDEAAHIAAKLAIPVLDLKPGLGDFRRNNPERRLYFPNDPNHPNAAGHAAIGAIVKDRLMDTLGVCAGVARPGG